MKYKIGDKFRYGWMIIEITSINPDMNNKNKYMCLGKLLDGALNYFRFSEKTLNTLTQIN